MSYTSDVETESRTHDAIETSCEVPERSAEKSIAVHRARAKRSSVRSACGQRLGWRHSNASKHVWSDRAERSTFAQTQFKNVIGLSSADSEYHSLTKGGCSGLGLQSLFADCKLKLQLSRHTDSSSTKVARALGTYRRGCCGYKNV